MYVAHLGPSTVGMRHRVQFRVESSSTEPPIRYREYDKQGDNDDHQAARSDERRGLVDRSSSIDSRVVGSISVRSEPDPRQSRRGTPLSSARVNSRILRP